LLDALLLELAHGQQFRLRKLGNGPFVRFPDIDKAEFIAAIEAGLELCGRNFHNGQVSMFLCAKGIKLVVEM